MVKNERYFFKEGKEMDKTCDKEGYRWCPIMKKCMPPDHFKGKGRGMHRGQGQGPVGNPTKEANELVDIAFDEGFEIFGKVSKATKQVDTILDGIGGAIKGVAGGIAKAAAVDLAVSGGMKAAGAMAKRRSASRVCKDKYKAGTPEYRQCMHKLVYQEGVKDVAKGAAKGIGWMGAATIGMSAAGAASKRIGAKRVCSDRHKPGTPEYRECMFRMIHKEGAKNPEDIDLGDDVSLKTSRPYDHPKQARIVADVEECDMMGPGGGMGRGGMMGGGRMNKGIARPEGEEEYEDSYDALPNDDQNDIPHVPDQDGRRLYRSIRKQLGEFYLLSDDKKEAYRAYFDSMLKRFGVSSPAELDDEKKKAFFNAVDKGWKSKKES
jgi:hypothetical protein